MLSTLTPSVAPDAQGKAEGEFYWDGGAADSNTQKVKPVRFPTMQPSRRLEVVNSTLKLLYDNPQAIGGLFAGGKVHRRDSKS